MSIQPLPPHGPLPTIERGDGDPLLLIHGFGLRPRTYNRTIDLLASDHRVLAPSWMRVDRPWSYPKAISGLIATMDRAGMARAVVVGHSFGGGLALGLAANCPERVEALVISDSTALAPRWRLARNALPGTHLFALATPRAAIDFISTAATHPLGLARAGWWGFTAERDEDIQAVVGAEVATAVMWAQRDTLLDSRLGRDFARHLHAPFVTVEAEDVDGPVDHDWMYRHPSLFVRKLHDVALPSAQPGHPQPADTAS